jgi:uncharacterized protein YjiS (DUF1127 family)
MQILHSCAAALTISIINSGSYLKLDCDAEASASIPKELSMLFTIMEIYGDWRRYNAGLSELSSLSDRELADIGISRADIYRVAWEKACQAA